MDFKWSDLTPPEQELLRCTAVGAIAEFGNEPSPDGPKIRAELIRALLLGLPIQGAPMGDRFVRLAGVRMRGARITGDLDLRASRGVGDVGLPGLGLFSCWIEKPVQMRYARIARLSYEKSRLVHVEAHGCHIDGPLDIGQIRPLKEGGPCSVDAGSCIIAGEMRGKGADLRSPPRSDDVSRPWSRWYALRLSDARIAGNVTLHGLNAAGGVTISAAHIGGDLWLTSARLEKGESRALNARSAKVGGMIMLISGFHASGEVSFRDAVVEGRLSCMEGSLAPFDSQEAKTRAFARIDGELDLRGAQFGSSLELGGGLFRNPGHWAINAAGVRVAGDFHLRPLSDRRDFPTTIIGGLRLEGAQIEGELNWENLILEGPGPQEVVDSSRRRLQRQALARSQGRFIDRLLRRPADPNVMLSGKDEKNLAGIAAASRINLADAKIGRAFKARRLEVTRSRPPAKMDAVIDLTGARCAALDDDLIYGWGQPDAKVWVMMEGFSYGRLELDVREQNSANSRTDRWAARRRWVMQKSERYEAFHPQPYMELAKFYREVGWTQDLSRCLEHERYSHMVNAAGGHWLLAALFRPASFAFWLISGFGHGQFRILAVLALYWTFGFLAVENMQERGRLVVDSTYLAEARSSPRIIEAGKAADIRCGDEIDPAIYALDVAIPVLDLRQEVQCEPGITFMPDGRESGDAHDLRYWRWAKALYALFGALLTAVAVLTFTGFARRESRQ